MLYKQRTVLWSSSKVVTIRFEAKAVVPTANRAWSSKYSHKTSRSHLPIDVAFAHGRISLSFHIGDNRKLTKRDHRKEDLYIHSRSRTTDDCVDDNVRLYRKEGYDARDHKVLSLLQGSLQIVTEPSRRDKETEMLT